MVHFHVLHLICFNLVGYDLYQQCFNQCVRNQVEQATNFHVGMLRVEERLLAMVVTKIIMPRGINHATLNEGDLVVMYCIQNGVMMDWTYIICDHIMKAKRLTNFKLPYVVLIFKFIEHSGVCKTREI